MVRRFEAKIMFLLLKKINFFVFFSPKNIKNNAKFMMVNIDKRLNV